MSKVTLTVATVATPIPDGVTPGALRFTLLDADGATLQSQDVASTAAVFTGIADGSFQAYVARLDQDGNVLGSPLTQPFLVGAPAIVTYEAPSTLSVSVEAE